MELISSFNPYFAGSSSGSFHYQFFIMLISRVSILILLEVVLEAKVAFLCNFQIRCFNPYFAGSSSGSFYS